MRGTVLASFEKQIGWCEALGSPFSAGVLGVLAADIAAGGIGADLVGGWQGDPLADALPLRLLGALHALVLTGQAPALALCYPPHDSLCAEVLAEAALDASRAHRDFVADFIASPPQTNEVGRSGVLLGGFLTIADAARLPLRLLEIGASAGLNLIWDRYRYDLGGAVWGDPASPVRLVPRWTGALPPMGGPLSVASRAACDIAPIDLEDDAARLRLRAYVWADQPERLARLDGAMALARADGHRVAQADAAHWVDDRLCEAAPGYATVLYHSIMWQYMPAASREAIAAAVQAAGARATLEAPFAWLRFEPSALDVPPELRLTLWPGAREQTLARAHPHGSTVTWF
jgi:hypothetical protein